METEISYQKNQIVWAKVHGYSWWPAIIAHAEFLKENNESLILVNFIGHNSHVISNSSFLGIEKIRDYEEFFAECAKTKNPILLKAICLANDIKNGLLTYEEHKHKMLLENKRFPQSNNNYPLKKFRKTNSSIKNLYKINEKNSLFAKETSKNKEKIQESFNLNEIISSNPFQRISRSIIKEMNIITTLDGFSEKKDKKTKKIKSKNEKTSKQTIQIKPEIKETLKIIENEKSLQNKSFELKLEECLLNLKNLKSKVLSKNKHEIAILSKLLNSYHDHGFSAEELFRSNVPKIFKTMYQFLNDVKIPQTEFVIIQLESILNHIKERVLDELLNNQKYLDLVLLQKNDNCLIEKVASNSMNLNISQNTIDEAKTPRNLSLAICLSDPTSTSTKPATNVNIQKNFKNINKKKLSIKSKHEFKNNTNLIAKPNLRKKICLKLAKNLQNIYSVEKNGSQKLSLTIESKIRNQFPLMNLEYKGEIKLIFQLLKSKKFNGEKIMEIFSLDYDNFSRYIRDFDILCINDDLKKARPSKIT